MKGWATRLMKTRSRNILLWVVSIWVIVMLALTPQFLAAHRETKDVERVFAAYTGSLVNQQFDDAYSRCGTNFQSAMSYDQFVSLYESMQKENGPLKSIKRVSYEVHGSGTPMFWRAAIDADLIYEKKSVRFEFVFHKQGGRWVLFGAEQL
jgi:hypothetical protein